MYNQTKDFKPYYCEKTRKHLWVLGYFGGGPVNYSRFKEVAEDFSTVIGCNISSVYIDEIFTSRRFKGFKFIASVEKVQRPVKSSEIIKDVWAYLNN